VCDDLCIVIHFPSR